MYYLTVSLNDPDRQGTAWLNLPNAYFPQPPQIGSLYSVGLRSSLDSGYAMIRIKHVGLPQIGPHEHDPLYNRDPAQETMIWVSAVPNNGPRELGNRPLLSDLTDFQRRPFRDRFLAALEQSGFTIKWNDATSA